MSISMQDTSRKRKAGAGPLFLILSALSMFIMAEPSRNITLEQAIQNVEFARQYRPLTDQQRASLLALGRKIAPGLGPRYGPVT